MFSTQVTVLVPSAEFHEEPMPYDLATPIKLIT